MRSKMKEKRFICGHLQFGFSLYCCVLFILFYCFSFFHLFFAHSRCDTAVAHTVHLMHCTVSSFTVVLFAAPVTCHCNIYLHHVAVKLELLHFALTHTDTRHTVSQFTRQRAAFVKMYGKRTNNTVRAQFDALTQHATAAVPLTRSVSSPVKLKSQSSTPPVTHSTQANAFATLMSKRTSSALDTFSSNKRSKITHSTPKARAKKTTTVSDVCTDSDSVVEQKCDPSRMATQVYLDCGQKDVGSTVCPVCSMLYYPGQEVGKHNAAIDALAAAVDPLLCNFACISGI